jgi:hypothetical protein
LFGDDEGDHQGEDGDHKDHFTKFFNFRFFDRHNNTIIISATRREMTIKLKVKEDQAKIYKGYGIDPADGEGNNKKTFNFAAVGDFGSSKNAKKTELDNPHTTLTGTFFDNKGNEIRDHFTTTKEIK